MLHEVVASLRLLLFPPRCACELAQPRNAEAPFGLCDGCYDALEPAPREIPVIAAYEYGGPIASTVVAAKFQRRRDSARALGRLLAAHPAAREAAAGCAGIVPVPLSPMRYWARGFNQAEIIAEVCGETWGLPVRRALRRVRDTPPQSDLPLAQRESNVEGAFSATKPLSGVWILVDDVVTSGATLRAASEALKRAGAIATRPMAVCAST